MGGVATVLWAVQCVLWIVLGGCLVSACVMDCRTCEVYNFIWWIAGTAAALLLLFFEGMEIGLLPEADVEGAGLPFLTGGEIPGYLSLFGEGRVGALLDLIVFCLIQLKGFSKLYGRADCHAFCVCAVAGTSMGWRFADYLAHMFLALGMLTIVQAFRHNINRQGNLKEPKAFLPYITLAFSALMLRNCAG